MPFSSPGTESDIEILNSWADGNVSLAQRRGTLASGERRKARYSIEVKSEPLLLDLNEMNLGGQLAEAWTQRVKDQLQGVSTVVSKGTQAMREKARIAFNAGAAWALKRYSGGRIGPMAPNQSDKFGNDSGRLIKSVHLRQNLTDASYTMNVASNRLNREQFGRGYDAFVERLISYAPILDPKRAIGDPIIERAVKDAAASAISKMESNAEAAIARGLARYRAKRAQVLKQIGRLALGALT
jgi:hypothetical protein